MCSGTSAGPIPAAANRGAAATWLVRTATRGVNPA